ncbi:hypothetical protein K501DRAFT_186472 [Backusella circina FSU 941]|nr:hypothetical protein K501DRAFT_186472 [Backusella circina FSU 941]
MQDDDLAAATRRNLFIERFGSESNIIRQKKIQEQSKGYTPLEKQVVELKDLHPGILLMIEVGYKFRFFGEDALIASRVLHIAHFKDRNFDVASVPVYRLDYHVRRLANAGYKVGVVRQIETAALKAIGDNKNTVFERKLTQLVTKGTIVGEMRSEVVSKDGDDTSYLMCLVEENKGGSGKDDRVKIGMVAVHLSTGDVIYDAFDDGFMRTELETRLLHIEPSEILIPPTLSSPSSKVIRRWSSPRKGLNDCARLESMPESDKQTKEYNSALTFVSDFYCSNGKPEVLQFVLTLPQIVLKTLAGLVRYLQEIKLEKVLFSSKSFKHFVSQSHMSLNGNTLSHLEVFRNSTTFTAEGSLFSVLDYTLTSFGKRQLKKWIGQPLVDQEKLNERVCAADELKTTHNDKKPALVGLLKSLPDIEKGICRIHYLSATPKEVIQVLDVLIRVSRTFTNGSPFESNLLNQLFDIFPTIQDELTAFREEINDEFKDKTNFFKPGSRYPEISQQKNNIKFVENELADYLNEVKKSTGLNDLQYAKTKNVEFQLEIKSKKLTTIPKDWIKMTGTKLVSRFHTPAIVSKLKSREEHRERLVLYAENAYKNFLTEIGGLYEQLREIVSSLATLDCLLSLSIVNSQVDYVKPTFSDENEIKVTDARHPVIEKLFTTRGYVPNDISFYGRQRNMVLTGPNMGGKSSYIRQVALISIMGQVGSYVPAKEARLGLFDAIYTRMGASDNMMKGESTFMVELYETSHIIKHATSKSLVILDELGRGTNTKEGQAIAYSVLHHFITEIKSIVLFVTHYPLLTNMVKEFPDCTRNCYMSYIEDTQQDIPDVVFLYKLVDGIAGGSFGLNVAKLAGISSDILRVAKEESNKMRAEEARLPILRRLGRNLH